MTMPARATAAATALIAACAAPASGQDYPEAWTAPTEPFRIVDNVYYVGAEGLSSFLITTPEGHFLLDGTMPGAGEMIAENIAALGFDVEDVEILLNSHAHFDHSGGLAELRALSGAEFYASEGDQSALENGFYLGWEEREEFNAPGIKVDHIVEDGDEVTLGGVTLTANIT
ncbi:MAG: metallo-beta-lactamase, partial [Maricaulaceae bacterium]